VQLRSLANDQAVFLLSAPGGNWSATSFTSVPVTAFPPGFAMATVFVNGIPSMASIINIVVPQVNLSVAGSGTVIRSPDQPYYPAGSVLTLTAVPACGTTFTGWSGAASGTENPLVIV